MDFGTATLQHCNTFTRNPLVINRKRIIVYGHNVTANYTFVSPTVQKPCKIAPKSPPFCPLSWLKKASFLPYFRFKTHQNRPKPRRKTPFLNPLGTV